LFAFWRSLFGAPGRHHEAYKPAGVLYVQDVDDQGRQKANAKKRTIALPDVVGIPESIDLNSFGCFKAVDQRLIRA